MKSFLLLSLSFILLSIHSFAGDVYAVYNIKGIGEKITESKMYFKNGDMRTEVAMNISGKEMTSTTLNLKSNPGVSIVYNSFSKTYTEVKHDKNSSKSDIISVSVIGDEKVGAYNCKHIRMKLDTTSWDMWVTKDLPFIDYPFDKNDEAANKKIVALLKSKSADGVPVKIAFLKPGTTTQSMTIELVKYESKNLDSSLFQIPAGYSKSSASMDPEKIKNMSPEEKKEFIMKMMEEQRPK
ncbi:MAG: DUF4412 domain-containing protein [Chitinophagaceae bacterium]|nr:DUF4412 domain-containing protein [Chitinophagaceae bacterium]